MGAGQAAFADCRAVRGAAVEQSLALGLADEVRTAQVTESVEP